MLCSNLCFGQSNRTQKQPRESRHQSNMPGSLENTWSFSAETYNFWFWFPLTTNPFHMIVIFIHPNETAWKGVHHSQWHRYPATHITSLSATIKFTRKKTHRYIRISRTQTNTFKTSSIQNANKKGKIITSSFVTPFKVRTIKMRIFFLSHVRWFKNLLRPNNKQSNLYFCFRLRCAAFSSNIIFSDFFFLLLLFIISFIFRSACVLISMSNSNSSSLSHRTTCSSVWSRDWRV